MHKIEALVFSAFLHKCPPEKQQSLLRFLPAIEAKEISELKPTFGDPTLGFSRCDEMLSQIHSSWLAPILRSLSESDIRLFLSCLSPLQIKNLKSHLLFSNNLPQTSFLASQFLKRSLFEKAAPSDLLPVSCLPQNPMNILTSLDEEELRSIIHLISMHDLSIEIRQVIDTSKLKQIYSILTQAQQTYLNTLLLKREKIAFKRMGLANWNQDKEALKKSLLQRGVNRVAKALYGQHPSLIWYVSRRLDIEKGTMLLNLCSALDHPQGSHLLVEQVVELAHSIHNYTSV